MEYHQNTKGQRERKIRINWEICNCNQSSGIDTKISLQKDFEPGLRFGEELKVSSYKLEEIKWLQVVQWCLHWCSGASMIQTSKRYIHSLPASRGGNQMGKFNFLMIPKWILLSFQYIRMGEKEFLNLVTVFTLHIDLQNLKIPIIGQKKNCRRAYIWVSKPIRRKIQEQWKKN